MATVSLALSVEITEVAIPDATQRMFRADLTATTTTQGSYVIATLNGLFDLGKTPEEINQSLTTRVMGALYRTLQSEMNQ